MVERDEGWRKGEKGGEGDGNRREGKTKSEDEEIN